MDRAHSRYEFGEFLLNPMERQLLRRGEPVPLTPKAFDLLVLLVKNNGHLLTKDELMSALWPTAFVEEINLTQNISLIRKILGSSSSGDRLVETIPKQGYRFRASVRELPGTNGSVPLLEVPADKARWRGRLILAAVLAAGACLLLVWFGVTRLRGQRMHAQIAPQSLAVFPLLNLSGDPGQEYFADGMTDELTTELARSRFIRVLSRTSATRYRSSQKSLSEIARQLHVDVVVEGSVVRSDDRVKLTIQLIDASTDRHLWAQSYECDKTEALSLPKQVAHDLANEIAGASASGDRKDDIRERKAIDPAVYEAYFKARYFWNKRTEPDLKRARAYFQEAIEKDPTYAPAYAGLAVWYDTAAAYSLLPASEAYPLSKVTAQKALSLDSTLAEAHVPLGVVKAEYEWDLPGAEEEFKRAISQNPNDLVAHQWYAEDVLEPEGRHDEAVVELKQAEQLDPSSLMSRAAVGYGFYFARNYDLAIDQEKRTLELEPSFPKAHQLLGLAYEQKGMLPEAVHEFETAVALDANPSYSLGLARAYALTGQKQKSAEILTSGAPQQHYAHAYQLALVYLAQGNRNEALSTLEKAQSDRCWMLIYANVDPRLDALRSDPRFQKILHAIRYS